MIGNVVGNGAAAQSPTWKLTGYFGEKEKSGLGGGGGWG